MTQRTFEIIVAAIVLLIAGFAFSAWRSSRDEQQRLQSTLATQKQLLDAADAREKSRNASLAEALAQIDALKHATQTPQQIVRDLPKFIPLPQPITLVEPVSANASNANVPEPQKKLNSQPEKGSGHSIEKGTTGADDSPPKAKRLIEGPNAKTTQNSLPDAPLAPALRCQTSVDCSAELPPADLKPLYDYVQDCRACEAELAVAKQNAADDATKIAALTSERDAAITAAKGGTFWRRLRRDAVWFALGVAAGSAAHLAVSH